MSRRILALALGAILALAAVVPALAGEAPRNATLKSVGKVTFKANRFIKDSMRFNHDSVAMRSGGTLTIADTSRQPHTLSLVKRSDLPGNLRQMDRCFGPGPCDEIAVDHGAVNPETGEEQDPTVLLVNKGPDGFNQPGDSVVIAPGKKAKVKVTAARGKSLYYLCAIHPWMQGRLDVE
ncbi:MAG: hypothetical protein QOH58_974 [Thermoleophilaceae bacterium]|jgi:plastocyanin|nr:hypothetical protein [Thermoleophilaceae bacterium]